jgi:HNH endonuclease
MRTLRERFEAKWTPEPYSGCWLWTRSCDTYGYGQIRLGRATDGKANAHRVSWALHKGEIPKGMCVLHKCDTPGCVNPDHLFLGSYGDNTQDMMRKKRHRPPVGKINGRAKLTEAQVLAIRVDPRGDREIAKDYGVWPSRIYDIKKRRNWVHV